MVKQNRNWGVKRLRLPCSGCHSETPAHRQSKRVHFYSLNICRNLNDLLHCPGRCSAPQALLRALPREQDPEARRLWIGSGGGLFAYFSLCSLPGRVQKKHAWAQGREKRLHSRRGFSDQKYLRGQVSPDCALRRAGEAQDCLTAGSDSPLTLSSGVDWSPCCFCGCCWCQGIEPKLSVSTPVRKKPPAPSLVFCVTVSCSSPSARHRAGSA